MSRILQEIKSSDRALKGIILKEIIVFKEKKQLSFNFINNEVVDEKLEKVVENIIKQNIPPFFESISIDFEKRVCDAEILQRAVYNYIKSNYIAISSLIESGDVTAKLAPSGFKYSVRLTKTAYDYFNKNYFINDLNAFLSTSFCESFSGELVLSDEKINAKEILSKAAKMDLFDAEQPFVRRIFEVIDIKDIDGGQTDKYAVYMADCDFESENLTVCGVVKTATEKQTKTGKPFFIFELSDGTYEDGVRTFRAVVFTRKKNVDAISEVQVGDSLIMSGKMQLFNGNLSFTADKVNYGKAPDNFVPEKRVSKNAPPDYITIRPEPYIELTQANLFDKKEIMPEPLAVNTFVVFDLETTGLVNNPHTLERMDTIIEIGAVKIVGGVITEQFSTLIKPDREITEEITKITGIDNDMVKDAPDLNSVLPDFFKFTRGAHLVGHNVEFDYKFIRHYSKELGYIYDNVPYDTLTLAQELLRLSNNKLSTVAAHFNIEFTHHRALSDALTTAKIFTRLIKTKKCLPY